MEPIVSRAGWLFFALVAGLYGAKLLWNVLVPLEMARRRARRSPAAPAAGISLMPYLDLALLLVGVCVSWLRGGTWPWSAGGVLLWGGALFVGSYAFLLASSLVVGVLGRRRDRSRPH